MSVEPRLHFTITPDTHKHVFHVLLQIQGDFDEGVSVFMPNWIAGSYMLRDFARHIVSIRAYNRWEQDVKLSPTSQFSWQTEAFTTGLTIEYEVFAHDNSVRTAFLDTDTGFFNATSVCLCVEELAESVHDLTLKAPDKSVGWEVATQLTRSANTPHRSFGDYTARNYDELADCPVRMGELTWLEFNARGIPHTIAISGEVPHLNPELLVTDVRSLCIAQLDLFHPYAASQAPVGYTEQLTPQTAPFSSFLFLVDARASGYGGLEHRNSTALLCSRNSLPQYEDQEHNRRKAYTDFLGLVSHEYFHSWNVKRIKPASFVSYDLTETIDTSLLWFFEGVTSYYDDLILLRAQILNEAHYFKILNGHLESLMAFGGSKQQNAVQAGFYAWTKYYQPTENSPNAIISYYTKGALIALCLDLFIRHNSQHKHSLDDVMRALWEDFGRDFYNKPEEARRGVKLIDLQKYISRFANTSAYHLLYVALYSTEPLPLNLLLLSHGLHVKHLAPTSSQLGASVKKCDLGWQIDRVYTDGIAERTGLAPQDILVAFNRIKLDKTPDETLREWPLNTDLVVHYWRDGVLGAYALHNQITPNQSANYQIERIRPQATSKWPQA